MKSFSDNRQRFVKKERGERTTTHKDVERAFEMYSDMIYRICFMYFKGNRYDIEDAVSAVFLKYMEHGTLFENQEHEKAWLIVAARNICKNMCRHWWRRNESLEDHTSECSDEDIYSDELLELVLALPEKQKMCIYLFYYEGYSCKEIGDILGIRENAVYANLNKGRNRLKELIEAEG